MRRSFFGRGLLALIGSLIPSSLPVYADCGPPSFGCGYINASLYQKPNREGQSTAAIYCEDNKCMHSRKKLSELYMYPGDPSNYDTWNDALSSVNFIYYYAWLLYGDVNFEGPCIAAYMKPNGLRPKSQPRDSGRYFFNLRDAGFDNKVSSYKLVRIDATTNKPSTRCRLVPLITESGSFRLVPTSP
jgi:hypothetical protein